MKDYRISSRLLATAGSIVLLAALVLSLGNVFPAQAGAGTPPTGTGIPSTGGGAGLSGAGAVGTGSPSTETVVPATGIAPTGVPPTGDMTVAFEGGDQAVCQVAPTTLEAIADVNLPAGQTALFQGAFNIVYPNTNDTHIVYQETTVTGGDQVVVSGNWPGINASDTVVEVHFGGLLLDPTTKNPISNAASKDFYWYPWYCNVAATPGVPSTGPSTPVTPSINVTVLPSGATAAPTSTAPVSTEAPTSTAAATNTAAPTLTSEPSSTSEPTLTSEPSSTPVPGSTIEPTAVIGETAVASPTLPVIGATAAPTLESTALPTGEATVGIPATGPSNLIVFPEQSDVPVCQMTATTFNTNVTVNLPAGVRRGILQSYVAVLSPLDRSTRAINLVTGPGAPNATDSITTEDNLGSDLTVTGTPSASSADSASVAIPGQKRPKVTTQVVTNGQVVPLTVQWPGVRSNDQAVELRVVVRVLNRANGRLIGSISRFFFWYPWVCQYLQENPTAVPTGTVVPTGTAVSTGTAISTGTAAASMTAPAETETLAPTAASTATLMPTAPAATGTPGVPNTGATGVVPSSTAEMTGTPSASETAAPSGTPEITGTPPVPPTGNVLSFENGDQAICQMNSVPISAIVDVGDLPAGQTAILQGAFNIVEPTDLASQTQYSEVSVTSGDRVEITGSWPGVRATDQVVEVHFGAILLDPATHNPISSGASKDYFWYPYVCAASGSGTGTPNPGETATPGVTETVLPATPFATSTASGTGVPSTGGTPVVGATIVGNRKTPAPTSTGVPVTASIQFTQQSGPLCTVTKESVPATIQVTLPRGVRTAILRTGYRVVAPFSARSGYTFRDRIVRNGQVVNLKANWPGISAGDALVAVHFDAALLDIRGRKPLVSETTLDYFAYSQVCQGNGTPSPSGTPSASSLFGSLPLTGGSTGNTSSFATAWNAFWTRVLALFGGK